MKSFLILFLFLTFFGIIGTSQANDSGSVSIYTYTNPGDYSFAYVYGGGSPSITTLPFEVATYNSVVEFSATGYFTGATYSSRSTTFTITSGGTGNGIVTYFNGDSKTITWEFSNTTITANSITLSYTDNIFADLSGTPGSKYEAQAASASTSSSRPMCIYSGNTWYGRQACQASVTYNVGTANVNSAFYSINYTILQQNNTNVQFFNASVTMRTGNTNIRFHDNSGVASGGNYFAESGYQSTDFNFTAKYGAGLWINMTNGAGGKTSKQINSTVIGAPAIPPGSGGSPSGQIYFDFSNAIAGSTFGINASIANSNYSAYTTYYLDTTDPTGAEITGFPVTFSTQTYSTGRLWSFQKFGTYNSTLKYCNMFDLTCSNTLKTGLHTLDSATILISPASGLNYSVSTDKANYSNGDTINFTIINPSSQNIYFSSYVFSGGIGNPNGVIALNKLISPGTSYVLKNVTGDMVQGLYSATLNLNNDYSNEVAYTTFNISSPSAGANKLSIFWGGNNFYGAPNELYYSSNYNTSTVSVFKIFPGTQNLSLADRFTIAANITSSKSYLMDVPGLWVANITDGNTTLYANITLSGRATGTCSQELSDYICWKTQNGSMASSYYRGDSYVLNWKLTNIPTPLSGTVLTLVVFNPDGSVNFNYSIKNGIVYQLPVTGYISGVWSSTAKAGKYHAVVYVGGTPAINYVDGEQVTDSYAMLLDTPAATTTGSVPGTTSSLLSGNFVLIILVLFAFVGVGYEIGDFMGAALGFGSGFIVLGVIGVMPVWALFLFGLIVITGFTVMAGKQIMPTTGK